MIPFRHMADSLPPPAPYRRNPRLDDLQNAREEIEWLRYDRGRWRGLAYAEAIALIVFLLAVSVHLVRTP